MLSKSSSNSSTSASVEGMGYAIPISEAKEVLDKLSNEETRRPVDQDERGYLGVSVVTSDESATQYYNIPQGAYVREVAKGGIKIVEDGADGLAVRHRKNPFLRAHPL